MTNYETEIDYGTHGMFDDECHFVNELCIGRLWKCETCGELFCETHWHQTSKGKNVECSGCEGKREGRY